MVGTFGRALEVRGIPSQPDRLSADIEGDIVDEDGVMALRAIRIRYRVALPAGSARKPNALSASTNVAARSPTP